MFWFAIALYIFVLLIIAYRSRKHTSADEFLMANRSASSWQVGAGLFTLIGGGEFVALAALGYLFGWSGIALFVGYALGFLFLGTISRKIRKDAITHKFISLPDYVHHNFGSGSGLIAFLFSFIAFFALLMLQFSAAGAVIMPFLNLPEWMVIFGVGAAVLLYLLIGGFKAVLTTDIVQGLAMLIVLPILVYLVMNAPLDANVEVASAESLPIFLWISLIVTGFFVVTASADVWQRAYAAASDKEAKSGFIGGGLAFLIFGFLIVSVGITARNLGLQDADNAFVEVMTNHLPGSVAALVGLLVLAAMMSTADTEVFLLTGLAQREIARFAPDSRVANFFESVTGVRILMFIVGSTSVAFAYLYSDLVGIYTWLLSALVVISPIVLFSLFRKASGIGMFFALMANTVLFAVLVGLKVLTLDNIFMIAIPGLVFYLFALMFSRKAIQ